MHSLAATIGVWAIVVGILAVDIILVNVAIFGGTVKFEVKINWNRNAGRTKEMSLVKEGSTP